MIVVGVAEGNERFEWKDRRIIIVYAITSTLVEAKFYVPAVFKHA